MSQTTVNLGYVLKNRGEYIASPETRYYHDNVVQYNGSSFIADPVDYNPETNPLAYVTTPPYDADPNQPNEGWKVFASDAAYVNSFMTWEENPEWVEVHLDAKQKILYGVKTDGEFFFGTGCPQQIKDYIEEKISSLSLDEYEDIVAFLSDYLGSDTTLKAMIDGINAQIATKEDKVEGKSLIDSEFAEGVSQVENPEFAEIHTDADDKVLYGVKQDGDFYFGAGVPSQVQEELDNKADLADLAEAADNKVDKEEGKSLIDADCASSQSAIDNPEYLQVTTDSDDKILEGIKQDGTKVVGGDLEVGGSATIGGDTKILGNMDISGVSYKVIESPEYLAAWVDAENKVIFGLKTDGKTYVGDADFLNDIEDIKAFTQNITDKNIDWDALSSITTVENPEFIEAKTDLEGKLLAGRTPDGAAFENVGFSAPKVSIDGYTIKNIEDPEGRTEIETDADGKILSYRDVDGMKHDNVGIAAERLITNHLNLSESGMTEFQQALINAGFNPKSVIDWSNEPYIHLPTKPKCAMINISGVNSMPVEKGTNSHAWIEFWDKNGNYFKKRAILDLQGRSSQAQYKKNFSADFCEDEWEGDDTTTLKFGEWVSQDGFHFKAYYTDLFKFANVISYNLWEKFKTTMPFTENKPFKEYFGDSYSAITGDISDFKQNTKDEAKCVPDGFPVMVYLNGEFYGLFSWQLKKHRDNYLLDRNNTDNIHLDGESYPQMFNGNIIWTNTEIRNPKPKKSKWTMYCMDGSKYDGDNPKELIDNTSEHWDETNTSNVKSAKVKANIIATSQYMSEINALRSITIDGTTFTLGDYAGEYNAEANFSKGKWVSSDNSYYMSKHTTNIGNALSDIDYWADVTETIATIREEIEKRFGVKWMIDYLILINLEKNGDAIVQNTQWITWGKLNGKLKWYPCPYDLDNSFGIKSTISFDFAIPEYMAYGSTQTTPFKYIYDFYTKELKARWKELRDNKIIDKDTIIRMLETWINNIGNDNLEMEYDKWSQSPCNRASTINPKWQLIDYYITYWDTESNWSSGTTYNQGSIVKANHRCFASKINNNMGNNPRIWSSTFTYAVNSTCQCKLEVSGKYKYITYKSLIADNININPTTDDDTHWQELGEYWEDVTVVAKTYNAGDEIWDGYSNFYKFKALETIVVSEDANNNDRYDHLVNTPLGKFYSEYPHEGGVYDSIYRIYKWIEEQIALMDSAFNYNQN